jgi:nicotinate-nucleotide adenylyltransferase
MQTKNQILIFGGSFNPFTLMHLEIVKLLSEHYQKIVLLPTFSPPHKSHSELLDFDFRIQLMQIGLKSFRSNSCAIEILSAEKDFYSQTQGYSYPLLKILKNQFEQDLDFVMGTDQLLKINTWHNWEKLIAEFNLVVITRNSPEVVSFPWVENIQKPVFLHKNTEGPSSSEIRQQIKMLSGIKTKNQALQIEGLDSQILKEILKIKI